jgi:hypothetical protein
MPPRPVEQRPLPPEYNEQFIELLAQRLMPRLMPQILYQVRMSQPMRSRSRPFGMSLALAIVSLVLMVPLSAIVLGVLTPAGGIVPALVGITLVGLVMVLINVLFNYMLFNVKS